MAQSFFETSPSNPTFGRTARLSLIVGVLLLVGDACVDLTPPWKQPTAGANGSGGNQAAGAQDGPSAGSTGADSADAGLDAGSSPAQEDARVDGQDDGPGAGIAAGADAAHDEAGGSAAAVGDGGGVADRKAGEGGSAERPDLAPDALDAPNAPAQDASLAVDVSPLGLLVYYPCEPAGDGQAGTLLDLSGNAHHGTLAVGPPPSGALSDGGAATGEAFSFTAGKVGNGLALNAPAYAYVGLPAGLLAGLTEVTVATWIKVKSTTSYQRIFDFGTDTTNFMYLATANRDDSAPRFRIVSSSAGALDAGLSQVLEGSAPIVAGVWTHVVLVLGPGGAALYVNGGLQASSTAVTLSPADLGSTTANYIGRSEFAVDPYLDAEIDEYRIYARALGADEVAALAAP